MMKEYTIIRKTRDLTWDDVPVLPVDTVNWDYPAAEGDRAFGQLCYDEDALYVRLTAVEKAIRAENTEKMAQPCEDSCLEFFFSPAPPDLRYFNIEFNPNALPFFGFGDAAGGPSLIRLQPFENVLAPEVTFLTPEGELPALFASSAEDDAADPEASLAAPLPRVTIPKDAEGWRITYRIPAAFIGRFFPGFSFRPGLTIRANCYKCGDLTEKPHYLSWNPMDPDRLSYHRPEYFGRMVFA